MKNIFGRTLLFMLLFAMAAGCGEKPNGENNGGEQEEKYDVYSYTSTASRSMTFNKSGMNFSTKGNMSPNTIRIDPLVKYQTMDGFGAALTGSTCYNLMRMNSEDRAKFMKEIFDTVDGLGYSYVRISIGCSDFSLSEYTCCDQQGIENFALTAEENNYVIPILKEALKYNPNIKILGSPWTCPRWMKVSEKGGSSPYNSWTGGHLNRTYYNDYATYFVKWLQVFKAQGINIYAITPQNEPLNAGNSASLVMEADEERDFVKVLAPALQEANFSTKIYVMDHNYDMNNYIETIYNDAAAASNVAGAAYHHYAGTRNAVLEMHNACPDKDIIFSEASIGAWNNGRDLQATFNGAMEESMDLVSKWCKAVIVWNLMLDMNGAPNRPGGCTTCYGVVDISTDYKAITRNNHYYEIGHFSKVVKSGAQRVKAEGYSPNGLQYQAFINPDGSYAMVLQNKSAEEISFVVEDNSNRSFTAALPGNAAMSLRW